MKMSDVDLPNYTDEQIQKAIENSIADWDWKDLRQYIIEEQMEYYCGNADSDEVAMLMEEHGEKEN